MAEPTSPTLASMTISSVMRDIKEKFKNEDEDGNVSPFQNLDKATVLHETKIFSDATMVMKQPRKCCQLITKLLHILTQGEPFTSTESTDVFFKVTKLFQGKDANLRRMMYLFIKEVADATAADEVIIVTQSLTKDMNCDTDLYRANAIRVLCRIIDTSMLTAIERYIKQAIVDKNPLVASSALVSGMHLMKNSPDVVRRWVNEVQEALNSPVDMVQYHALALLYQIRQHDKLAVSKLITQLQKTNLKSNLACCLLIRYSAALLADDLTGPNARPLYQFLEKMLRHKSEMVLYEAARAICVLPLDSRDLQPAITVLQILLGSVRPTLRFAAVRTLSLVALTQPMLVTKCNEDLETLIGDSNRSIATLAITTLLKTGAESSVDRLMKQINAFMSEIADEFKIVVVDAIRNLCVKYPQKHRMLLNALATFLRDEGGFEFKKTITEAMLDIIAQLPEAKEAALLHLCEFIEDCEFTLLSCKILHVLGQQGPTTPAPSRYIRFIYNRIILENATIRASAVSALTAFATRVPALAPSIRALLQRCMLDDDDEVRDRATMYLSLTTGGSHLLDDELPLGVHQLHKALEQYALRPSEGRVTLDALPFVAADAPRPTAKSAPTPAAAPEDPAQALYKIPQFAELGPLFRSAAPVELTEAETEYVVACVKHVFRAHVVLEYQVLNTVPDQVLQDVAVNLELLVEDVYEVQAVVPLPTLPYGEKGSCYVCLAHVPDADFPLVPIANELKFRVVEAPNGKPAAGDAGYNEEYPMEDLELSAADLMAKVQVPDFRSAWEHIGDEHEVREQYALRFQSLVEGVGAVIEYLGMFACDNSSVPAPKATAHVLILSGVFVGGVKVLVKCRLSLEAGDGQLLLQMGVRSEDELVSRTVADCIR
ncbi:coatomer subunit gamma [Achlya hypogyna]|uniref:Coatomer subunit gamma n=1 Tax=Achlya hypogyna TaxID=1202772 RepID=A0A1V9YQY2_ACHHY|nr:coatomer subunit gamma [Achlya hypogyna]